MELGTIDYPFRDINLVFIEVFNEHQHTDRNISIYVKEVTKNYIPIDFIQIVNVTKISIDSYTQNELLYDAQNAEFNLMQVTEPVNITTVKSLFNIIQNTVKGDLDSSRMDAVELAEFNQNGKIYIRPYRTRFNINHISVTTEPYVIYTDVVFVYTVFGFK